MANQLNIKSYFEKTYWVVDAVVAPTSDEDFPREIFLWTVAKDGSLDKFQAIGHADQIAKYPLYDSSRKGNFGIHLVRCSSSRLELPTAQDRDNCVMVLKAAFDTLVPGYEASAIPVEESYPL